MKPGISPKVTKETKTDIHRFDPVVSFCKPDGTD